MAQRTAISQLIVIDDEPKLDCLIGNGLSDMKTCGLGQCMGAVDGDHIGYGIHWGLFCTGQRPPSMQLRISKANSFVKPQKSLVGLYEILLN